MKERVASLRATFANPLCRPLFAAQLVSGLGDWAGRLALSLLVFDRSESVLLTALTVAVTLVPWLGPGQLLATFSERFGRVQVMVASDLARAAVFGLMALGPPLPLLLVLAFAAGLGVPPFAGAKSSALVEITDEHSYGAALAVFAMVVQTELVLGYLVGGVLVATVGASTALALNAVSFLVSAVLVSRLSGSAASQPNPEGRTGLRGVVEGIRPWRADRVCRRALALFVLVGSCAVLPEALVVPFVDSIGVPTGWAGPLAAVVAVGAAIGTLWMPSHGPPEAMLATAAWRVGAAAVVASVVLWQFSSLPMMLVAYLVTGMVDAVAIPTNQVVGQRLPAEGRSAAITVAMGAQNVAQVVAISTAGLVADLWNARHTLAAAMVVATAVCAWSLLRPVRDRADVRPG